MSAKEGKGGGGVVADASRLVRVREKGRRLPALQLVVGVCCGGMVDGL